MIGLGSSALKIYLAVEPCDMRMGFNGLANAATEQLAQGNGSTAGEPFCSQPAIRVFKAWS